MSEEFNIENTRAQIRKGILEVSILLTIAQGEVYASDIIAKLVKADLIVVEGTLYPLLSRLKRTGMVEYSWKESKSGPPRKYYSLTSRGQTALKRLLNTWKNISGSVTKLVKQYEKSN